MNVPAQAATAEKRNQATIYKLLLTFSAVVFNAVLGIYLLKGDI